MELDNQTLTISQLSALLNISKPTLRYWEKEFEGILVPLRTAGGQRRYASEHVPIIEKIRELKMAGLSLAEIRMHLNENTKDQLPENGIELLAVRVAEVVKKEILNFLKQERNL